MKIITVGGGICGLGAALLLARDGHDVTLLERDPGGMPTSTADAWERWERKGVAQFRQPHNFMPGLRLLLEAELPDVQEALGRAGAGRFDFLNPLPPSFSDRSPRPIDEQLWTLTGRRPVCEWVFAHAAQQQSRLTVRHGVRVCGLLTGTSVVSNRPHVTGVRTADGEEFRADLVVDASGRQSACPQWLQEIGAPAPYEEQADSGFTYYTRYFAGTQPERVGPTLTPFQSISLLTLPGDNGTWSVVLTTHSADRPLRGLRDADAWQAAVATVPLVAHWAAGSGIEPITGVDVMAGLDDRHRSLFVDGKPVVTGVVLVGDAWACSNPSAGRGLSVGIIHAQVLRDALRNEPDDAVAFAHAHDAATEEIVAPFYWNQINADRFRIAQMTALRDGREPPPPDANVTRFLAAAMADADVFRGFLETVLCLATPQQVLARPDVAAKVQAIDEPGLMQLPGPDRGQLLALLGAGS